ncbi:MAG: hypothetical protein JST26_16430 [Bacteroidetes bacterium]|nr:hypothetical protein [Bacteroidota bacterium]
MLNAIVPRFIKRLDKYFLLHYPILWISKIHYVLYFAVIMWALSALIGFAMPVNLAQPEDMALWYVMFTVLAIILFCVWLYKNTIFNVEKKFGNRHWTDEFKLFFLYTCTIFIYFSFAYPFSLVYSHKVANAVSTDDFIHDINILNESDAFIADNFYKYYSYTDTTTNTTHYDINRRVSFGENTPYMMVYDSIQHPGLLTNKMLEVGYNQRKKSDEAILEILNKRVEVFKRYHLEADINPADVLHTYRELCKRWQTDSNDVDLIRKSYSFMSPISRIFDNVAEAKFQVIFLLRGDFITFELYFTFYVCLIFLLFRNVRWQHFLVTIVSMIVVSILLLIISLLFPYYGDYDTYITGRNYNDRWLIYNTTILLIFLSTIIFTIVAVFQKKRFSAVTNIFMQVGYIIFPMMPLFIVFYIREYWGFCHNPNQEVYDRFAEAYKVSHQGQYDSLYSTYEYQYNELLNQYYNNQYYLCCFIAQWLGVILFIALVMPFMKSLFVKQLALPRKK